MKCAVVFAFLLCLLGISIAGECGSNRYCPQNFEPACGQRIVDGKMVRQVFGNFCELTAAMDCDPSWQPCSA